MAYKHVTVRPSAAARGGESCQIGLVLGREDLVYVVAVYLGR